MQSNARVQNILELLDESLNTIKHIRLYLEYNKNDKQIDSSWRDMALMKIRDLEEYSRQVITKDLREDLNGDHR